MRHEGTRARGHEGLAVLTLAFVAGCAPIRTVAPVAIAPAPVRPVLTEEQQQQLGEAQNARGRGDYEQALRLFREILAENPAAGDAYVGIGQVFLDRGDYASAEPALARAVRLEPRSFDAQYGHGLALQMLDRLVEAIRAYHLALTIRPASAEANQHLATTYLQLGQPQSALAFAQKAVELNPASGPARSTLGLVYTEVGRTADAIVEYQATIELMDVRPPLLMNFIGALVSAERYGEARDTAQWLVRIDPSVSGYERLGWCEFRLGDYDASLEAYRKAIELDPRHWQALNGVGCNCLNKWLLGERRDAALAREAQDAFRRSLTANPDQPKVIDLLQRYGL